MIKPTVGRIVWYRTHNMKATDQPCAAIVTYVHSDTLVNLAVFGPSGGTYSRTSIELVQDDVVRPESGDYCEWMPYQKAKAKQAG